ncbi:hypothetical protein L1987_52720 [Smallanthus sonchifolius]|uniref:Uncharacterized protein n=1 Tax=Smallanthus sonchifolius TaxID=185202 RepID=A0ACB9EU78_9ASTR|nr:hypothetical protein L1987_52720 [Smallanthus sonchifolius]
MSEAGDIGVENGLLIRFRVTSFIYDFLNGVEDHVHRIGYVQRQRLNGTSTWTWGWLEFTAAEREGFLSEHAVKVFDGKESVESGL